jgi:hypothetical protein
MSHTFHLVQKEIRYFIRKLVIFPIEYALAVFIGKYRWKYFFSGIIVGKEEMKKQTKKYNNISFLHIDFLTDLNQSVNPLKTLSTIYKGLSLI